ncbi:hypothetical protein D3C77_541200 [compost metagenome]
MKKRGFCVFNPHISNFGKYQLDYKRFLIKTILSSAVLNRCEANHVFFVDYFLKKLLYPLKGKVFFILRLANRSMVVIERKFICRLDFVWQGAYFWNTLVMSCDQIHTLRQLIPTLVPFRIYRIRILGQRLHFFSVCICRRRQ